MKTTFVRQIAGIAFGIMLFGGCARPSAQTDRPAVVTAPAPPPMVVADAQPATPAPAAPALVETAAADASATNEVPAIVQRIPPAAPTNASAGVYEVIKLAQAGVSEDVMLAYVERFGARFDLNADDIVYLNDLGVSTTVVTAMLKHDGSDTNLVAAVQEPPGSLIQTQQVSNVPTNPLVDHPQPPPTDAAAIAAPLTPPSSEVAYFYDSLAPYGSWLYVSGYGWCWQPTVAVVTPTWRPYADRGRWYWSDSGWYWHSDYTWGWAPFHYGRWYRHPRSGWIWTPGVVWGPAWVSWRYTDGYCGWAPLPPEAHFVYGSGFRYYGRHVSVGFDFGLSPYHYTFVSIGNFCDYAPYRYALPHTRVVNIYRSTTVVNNYHVRNNTFVNHGVGRETVARASRTQVREVTVRPTAVATTSGARIDRLEKHGNQLVVHRPQLPKDPPARPAAVANRMAADINQSRATRAQPATGIAAPTGGARASGGDATGARPQAGGRAVVAQPGGDQGRSVVNNQPRVVRPQEQQAAPQGRTVAPRRAEQPAAQVREPVAENRNQPAGGAPVARPVQPQRNPVVAAPSSRPEPQTPPQQRQIPVQRVAPAPNPNSALNAAPAPVQRTQPYAQPGNRVFAEPRAIPAPAQPAQPAVRQPSVYAPATPSPRYAEQHSVPRAYNAAPAQRAPAYSAPPTAAPGSRVNPGVPRPQYQAPAPAAPRVERQSRAEPAPSRAERSGRNR